MSVTSLFLLLTIFLTTINMFQAKLNYVICADGISACGDFMQCCRKGTGYRCCSESLCCCQQGNYCCFCSSLRSVNIFLSESKPSQEKTDFEVETMPLANNSTEVNAFYGTYLVFDAFLNVTGYYKHSRNAAGCRDEVQKVIQDLIKEISILNDKVLINNKPEFFAKLSSGLSELLFHTRELLQDCEHAPEEFRNIVKQITNYVSKWENHYLYKVTLNVEMNLGEIMRLVTNADSLCKSSQYEECGRSLGRLFNLVFEI